MKKIASLLLLLVLSLSGFSQSIGNLPSNLGTYTAFKANPLTVTINMPVGYVIPTPVTAEVWASGSKISITPTANVAGQVITVSMPATSVARLPAVTDLFVKFNGVYKLGATVRVSSSSGTPSATPYTVTLPDIGGVKINLIGDAGAAKAYADRAKVLKDSIGLNQWTGTTACYAGTSIVWQYQEFGKDYPTLMAKKLGMAKMWNMGISGSAITFKAPTTVGAGDGRPGMAGTIAQQLASGFAQNYSYENRIIPMLYPPFNCTVVIIGHLRNDIMTAGTGDSVGVVTSRDIGTLMGAYNVVFDAIYAAKPLTKVIVEITPNMHEYGETTPALIENGKRLRRARQAVIDVCTYRGVPYIDLSAKMGITDKNVFQWTSDGLHLSRASSIRASYILAHEMLSIN